MAEADAAATAIPDAPTGTDTSTSTPEPNVGGSGSSALTPEQQDAANIRSEFGIDPYTLQPVEDDGTAGAGEGEPETGEDGAADSEGTADSTDLSDAGDEFELTDEQLDALLEAVPEERLLNHPRMKDRYVPAETVQERIQRDLAQRQAAAAVQTETQQLVDQGATAVRTAVGAATAAVEALTRGAEELRKAAANEEFDPSVIDPSILNPEAMLQTFREFGSAVVLDTRRSYDEAFSSAFKAGEAVVGALSDDEKQSIIGIVQSATRIENDPEQGPDAAKTHLMSETMKLLVTRARAAGRAEALAEVQQRREAVKKVVGDDGVLAAATAKLAKARKNLPPTPIQAPAESEGTGDTMDAYDAAVAAKNYDLADQIAARMAQARAAGRR